jgi:hypothetical protein
VKANQAVLPVQAMCKTLRVSHSGYCWTTKALDRQATLMCVGTDAHNFFATSRSAAQGPTAVVSSKRFSASRGFLRCAN